MEVHNKNMSSMYLLYVEICCRNVFLSEFSMISFSKCPTNIEAKLSDLLDPMHGKSENSHMNHRLNQMNQAGGHVGHFGNSISHRRVDSVMAIRN